MIQLKKVEVRGKSEAGDFAGALEFAGGLQVIFSEERLRKIAGCERGDLVSGPRCDVRERGKRSNTLARSSSGRLGVGWPQEPSLEVRMCNHA